MVANAGICERYQLEGQLKEHVRQGVLGNAGRLGRAGLFIPSLEADFNDDLYRRHGGMGQYVAKRVRDLRGCLDSSRARMDAKGILYVEKIIELLEEIRDAGGIVGIRKRVF